MLKNRTTDMIPIRVHGRTDGRKYPIPLFWTGSCVEVNVTGSELSVEYESDFSGGEAYLRIEIDGADMYRFMLEEGRHTLRVFRGFPHEAVKNVRIYRENQASNTSIAILSFTTDGEFSELPERRLIEFFGDSITSGEGLAGAQCLQSWIPAVFSCRGSYTLLTARELGLDHSIVAQSGWGVYCSWNNVTENNVPRLYDKVCAAAGSEAQLKLGAASAPVYGHKPDINVIFLGANDSSGFVSPPWVDADGVSHKLETDEKGEPLPSELARISDAIRAFTAKLRADRPNSLILWCARDIKRVTRDFIFDTVNGFAKETGDGKLGVTELPVCDPSANGSRNHPGPEAHRRYAEAIVAKLREMESSR